jgi:chondroitin 4-sulfotransferase 11
MPVSHSHKTIFVHIPKTAGTSIEAVLGMHGDKQDIGLVPYFNQELDHEHLYGRQMQHMTAQAIRTVLNNDAVFNSYFKFAVVRNPWDRLVSALAWTDQKWVRGEELTLAAFETQVRQLHSLLATAQTAPAPVQLPHYLYPQSLYIFDAERRPLVNFIARYESLATDWRVIREKLGLSVELPARMKSHHRDYREYYSAATRQLVADMYALDVSLFEYEF